jgi:NOL1/NOP2/fmu family ribosome biogenesis protein
VQLCAVRQRRILAAAWGALRKGGILVYSTCTFNRTENEDNVVWLAGEHNCEVVHVDTADLPGMVCGEAGGIETFRFFPHRITGEGFFAAVFRKGGNPHKEQNHRFRKAALGDLSKAARTEVASWCAQSEYMRFGSLADGRIFAYYGDAIHEVNLLADRFSLLYSGVETGQLINGKLKPEASLALFHGISRERVPEADLDLVDALRYLRRNEVAAGRFVEGVNLVTFQGLPLGWIKRIGRRSNNLFPKEWRIMNY